MGRPVVPELLIGDRALPAARPATRRRPGGDPDDQLEDRAGLVLAALQNQHRDAQPCAVTPLGTLVASGGKPPTARARRASSRPLRQTRGVARAGGRRTPERPPLTAPPHRASPTPPPPHPHHPCPALGETSPGAQRGATVPSLIGPRYVVDPQPTAYTPTRLPPLAPAAAPLGDIPARDTLTRGRCLSPRDRTRQATTTSFSP